MEILDSDNNVIPGATYYNASSMQNVRVETGEVIVDGSVDVDVTRGARRTMNISLLNPGEVFSPNFYSVTGWPDNDSWSGTFFIDRKVRLYRGIQFSPDHYEVVPVGTFYVDTADIVAERNMSMVVLSGTDEWKRFSKAKFGGVGHYDKDTHVNDVVKSLASKGGVTRFNLDDLTSRHSTIPVKLTTDLDFERGAEIGPALTDLGTNYGFDIYFDPMGRLTTEDIYRSQYRQPVWTYDTQDPTSAIISVKSSYNDDRLYNHVRVTGTADEENPVFAQVRDSNPNSLTHPNRIGLRTFEYESKFIATTEQAQTTALQFLLQHMILVEDVELQVVANPSFEGNDSLKVIENTYTRVGDVNYQIRSMNIPLSGARQSLKMTREINTNDLEFF